MIYAAVCPQHMTYRYRTPDLPDGQSPAPTDFEPVNGQTTEAVAGQEARCDECSNQLVFKKLADEAAYNAKPGPQSQPSPSAVTPASPPSRRLSVAPATGAVTELFKVGQNEEVREMRPIAGDRILVVTNTRVVVIDPNLVGESA